VGAGTASSAVVSEAGDVWVTGVSRSHEAGYGAAVLLKYGADGTLLWERLWKPTWGQPTAGSNAAGHALDLCGDRLLVAGTTGAAAGAAESWVFVLAVDPEDGELLYQRGFDPSPNRSDRLHAVRCGPDGAVYAAGWEGQGSSGLLLRLVDGALDWALAIPVGYGAAFDSLDVDAAGNAYLSVDYEAIDARLEALAVSPSGELLWARTYNDAASIRSKSSLVALRGCGLWLGGMGAVEGYDRKAGDSLLLRLGRDGEPVGAWLYFTGDVSETTTADRVQSLVFSGGSAHVFGSIWANSSSVEDYGGTWHSPEIASAALDLHQLRPTPRTEADESVLSAGALREAAEVFPQEHSFDVGEQASAAPAEERAGDRGAEAYWGRLSLR